MSEELDRRYLYMPNKRLLRAQSMASAVMQTLGKFIKDDNRDEKKYAHRALMDLFMGQGVEVITDRDRIEAGLPLRDEYGITEMELQIIENRRMTIMAEVSKPLFVNLPDLEQTK